ncbi:Carbon starvation protein CstA [Ruminococcaceae bacterium YRB3002]|nr:Carbon starvation protein CstA [Ruminococcaceae bacterium YRB3002]
MITFLTGLAILIVGGALYGRFCERVFAPDDRKTPAYEQEDGVDYVPMKRWKNCLINLLNIAGTGPILGPIQGILFGPVAFITIPLGCVVCGAVHDYFSGMICTRMGGIQMPEMVKRHTNKYIYGFFTLFICLATFLCASVFIYTPGDIMATQLLGFSGSASAVSTWVIYGALFAYYLVATVLPIDKIIGKIYPVFGILLILSAIGILAMLFIRHPQMCEIWGDWELGGFDFGHYFNTQNFIPSFFVTVACGILSGFHSSQTALVSRTLQKEKDGRMAFYNMMLCEGFIAMVWAAGTMAVIGMGAENAGITMKLTETGWGYYQMADGVLQQIAPTSVVGVVCKSFLGSVGGVIAIIGVIILPISTGDTALRALRLMIAEVFHIGQKTVRKRLIVVIPICALVLGLLIWAKSDANGFNVVWRYFGWANQTSSVFATAAITIYLMRNGKAKFAWMPLIPFIFYTFVTSSYFLNSPIGLSLSINLAYIGAGIFTAVCFGYVMYLGIKKEKTVQGSGS